MSLSLLFSLCDVDFLTNNINNNNNDDDDDDDDHNNNNNNNNNNIIIVIKFTIVVSDLHKWMLGFRAASCIVSTGVLLLRRGVSGAIDGFFKS